MFWNGGSIITIFPSGTCTWLQWNIPHAMWPLFLTTQFSHRTWGIYRIAGKFGRLVDLESHRQIKFRQIAESCPRQKWVWAQVQVSSSVFQAE